MVSAAVRQKGERWKLVKQLSSLETVLVFLKHCIYILPQFRMIIKASVPVSGRAHLEALEH